VKTGGNGRKAVPSCLFINTLKKSTCMSDSVILNDATLIEDLNTLVREFVMGDYELMITENRLRGTPESAQIVRDFVAKFPGRLIMTPSHSQSLVRAIFPLKDHKFPDAQMIAVNLWFDDTRKEVQGDLLLEIICQKNASNRFDLLIYNVLS
jgi:hypothetical protein